MILKLKIELEDNSSVVYTTLSLKIIRWEILKRKFILDQLISENLPHLLIKLLEKKKDLPGKVSKREGKKKKIDYINFLRNFIKKKIGRINKIIFFVHKDDISEPDFISTLSYIQALYDKKMKIIPSDKYELQVEFDVKFFALISSIISALLRGKSGKKIRVAES